MGHEHRVFTSFNPLIKEGDSATFPLNPDDVHHLSRVLRMSTGASLTIVHSELGIELTCTVQKFSEGGVTCAVKVRSESSQLSSRVVSISCALTKGKGPELICEKSTELGARNIFFFQSTRSIVRLAGESERLKKEQRLAKIAQEAAKQSARRDVPEVRVFSALDSLTTELTNYRESHCFFLASLSPLAATLKKLKPEPALAHLLIGPEGDLTHDEEQALVRFGFQLLTLGPLRLRSETAALAAISTVNAEWGFS